MKKVEIKIDINSAMAICVKNGILIYPIISGSKFKIEVNDNGKLIRGKHTYDGKIIASIQAKAYKYYAKLILKKK